MRKLGYEFQPGKYLRVRIPGRKIYHRLDKMHEMFEEGKLDCWVDMPYMAKPYFYSNNPEKIYRADMSEYQKNFYAKIYRMRVIEHKRFDYKSAYYAEELRKLYKVHDEYLLLVKNDIRDLHGLIQFMDSKESEIKSIDERQHKIYKENQRRKRKIVTTEEMRKYQSWHLSVEKELAKLKEEKKKAKYDYKLAGNVLRENVYTALLVDVEREAVKDVNEVVMPEFAGVRGNKDNSVDKEEVAKVADEVVPVEDTVQKDENVEEVVSVDTISEGITSEEVISKEILSDTRVSDDGMSNERKPENAMENVVISGEVPVRNDVVGEIIEEKSYDFPKRYTDYLMLALEKRVELHGLLNESIGTTVFDVVRQSFDKAGYRVGYNDIYNEATAIENYISGVKRAGRVERIANQFKECGSYENIPSGVKAEVFGFEIDDSSGNLKLYMNVVKALGLQMKKEEMFEDYQKVYEETIKRQDSYDVQKDKMWEHSRAR